ncbi:MAG: glycoside hydrolase family 127 protein [Caldilineaceae bacterium]|nr:glycoside hydrolase family 127 protein [Caldilineaceae bacterium]
MHDSLRLRFHPLSTGQAQWREGFWGERFALCRDSALQAMEEILNTTPHGASLHNFPKAAGQQTGAHEGTKWSDGDCYKWLEALTHVYAFTRDEQTRATLETHIANIAAAQEEDGYISTQIQLTDKERWTDLHDHELYNMGHLLTAAVTHHRVTGSETFLTVARKLGDYLYELFVPRPPALAHFGFNPSQIMGCVDLYRATGDTRYLELAGVFVDMRGSQEGGSDVNQSYMPLRQETTAVGHAVTSAYLYSGATDVLAERSDPALQDALTRIWRNVVDTKSYVTGGTAALHHGTSQRPELFHARGSANGQLATPVPRRSDVHEAYGLEYHLPNATAYNETCANIAQAMWSLRMLRLTGEVQYADNMELVLYNSMLSGMSLDGLRFCYTNPLRWYGEEHVLLSQDYTERWADFHCYCCPPNVLRTLVSLHEWAYGRAAGELWVNLYGASEVSTDLGDGRPVALRQDTQYPWDGTVELTVTEAPGSPFSLLLRIPAWARGATVTVNGAPGPQVEPGTYCRIERQWQEGDRVALQLPLRVRCLQAHPKVEEARNQVAFVRGPIVYCAETADLTGIDDITDLYVPRTTDFTPHREQGPLGDTVVLQGQGLNMPAVTGPLYTEAEDVDPLPIPLTLIPYFTWNNRDPGQMSVWLPLYA